MGRIHSSLLVASRRRTFLFALARAIGARGTKTRALRRWRTRGADCNLTLEGFSSPLDGSAHTGPDVWFAYRCAPGWFVDGMPGGTVAHAGEISILGDAESQLAGGGVLYGALRRNSVSGAAPFLFHLGVDAPQHHGAGNRFAADDMDWAHSRATAHALDWKTVLQPVSLAGGVFCSCEGSSFVASDF